MYFFSLVVATLDERIKEFDRLLRSLENQTFSNFELVVVSQGDYQITESMLNKTSLNYTHVYSDKKGLSIARNIGLGLVCGKFISISDDDCWYPTEALERVKNEINKNRQYDAFTFQIYDPIADMPYKKYAISSTTLNYLTICKVSSIELFFSHKIIESGILFDERFGLGAIYNSGEENIFLGDVLKRNFLVIYLPSIVVYHRKGINRAATMGVVQMKSKYYLFRRLYSFVGILFYYTFYLKHISLVGCKIKSLFPFW